MKTILIILIRLYQKFISPLFPPVCRYTPTCSEYMAQAISRKGLLRGLSLGIIRILKCNPFFPGGHDPVT